MRFWPYVIFVLLLGQLAPVWAQDTAPVRRLEGTVTQAAEGASARAQLAFESPASLKISIEANPAAQIPAQVILATGDETRLYEPLTRRVRRLPYNIAREWYRGWNLQSGGPANFAFANTPLPAKVETRWHRDAVLFGGSGDRAYYAANKSLQPLWPTIELGTTPTRREKDATGTVLAETQVEWTADKLPAKATTVADGITTTFTYDLKTRADVFPANTFQLPAEAADAVVEDEELNAASTYTGADASAHFNRGTALAVGTEDYAAAVAEWNQAAALAPKATAPVLAILEAAMTARDFALAANTLSALGTRNLDKAELAARQSRLALARRDYALALSSIEAARLAAPQDFGLALQRADILRQRGDLPNATTALLEILKANAPLPLQVNAAEALVALAGDDTLAQIPTDTEPQKLARSLILLNQGKDPETTEYKTDLALASYAAALERAGRDNDAQTAWTTVETRAPLDGKNIARAHLVAIAARRGDTAASLRAFRDWNSTLTQESDRTDARLTLFDAWQKAFKHDVLLKALQNRSLAGGATNDDMRLWLAWQETYGEPEDVRSLVETGSLRFSSDPFWQSKLAEVRVTEANDQPGNDAGLARREKLFREANQALDRAVSLAPKEPFYAMQRVLVAVQRARPRTGVIDAARNAANAAAARTVFDGVEKDWPDDPDVGLTVALAQLGLSGDAGAAPAQTRATAALNSPPNDGERHTLILAARQALGRVARRQRNLPALQRQFLTLINAAPTATEQAGLANSLLSDLEAPDAPQAAMLLAEIARQPWDYSESRVQLDGVAGRAADVPGLGWPTLNVLQAQNDGASILAAVALTEQLYDRAEKAINTPQAPPVADADFDRATNARNATLPRLAQVTSGPDPMLAGRAAALLAENTTGADALKWIRQAVASEPTDPALRLTLMEALLAAGNTDEAKQERDNALRIVDLSPDTRRRLALFSLRPNDAPLAYKLALEAYNEAVNSPAVDANTFQRIAFATAHISFANRQPARGLDIYNGLASPQWGVIDRAAALIALRMEYLSQGKQDEAAKIVARFQDLGVTEDEKNAAQSFLDSLAS